MTASHSFTVKLTRLFKYVTHGTIVRFSLTAVDVAAFRSATADQ
jgi:hypothetical protein